MHTIVGVKGFTWPGVEIVQFEVIPTVRVCIVQLQKKNIFTNRGIIHWLQMVDLLR